MKANGQVWVVGLLAAGLGLTAIAQEAKAPDVYTPEALMGMEAKLAAKADASGLATETLKKYSTDYSMLAFRSQSGQAELHEKFADFYVVVDGNATLVSGGQMEHGAKTAPGEMRGASITGGKETQIGKGDIVHVPADIPHQLLLKKGDTLKYFIVKVQEVQ